MDGGATNEDLPAMFHERLHSALELMVDFFHAEGHGLSTDLLHSPTFCQIEQRLQYHRTDTEKLMEIFYAQRLHDQFNTTTSPYGNLAVRAYFNHDSLCVEVLIFFFCYSYRTKIHFLTGTSRSGYHSSGPKRFQRPLRNNRTTPQTNFPPL